MKFSLRHLLWIWVLAPPLVVVATELNKGILVWNFRIVDFVDLVLMAPFYLIILLTINAAVFKEKRTGGLFWLAIAMIGVFMYGHAMHLTGNAINTFATEVHNYRPQIPDNVYSLIYFLDEDLGHWLVYTGLFILIGIWGWIKIDPIPFHWTDALAGIIFGGTYAIAIIESSQPWLSFVAATWFLFVLFKKISWRFSLFSAYWKSDFFWRFLLVTALAVVVVEIVYAIVMGGFVQPSQLGY